MCLDTRDNPAVVVAPLASRRSRAAREGLTVVELLIAAVIMTMIVGVVAGLASAVRLSTRYSQSLATASQHGRVALERISQAIRSAHATDDEPGFVVIVTVVDGWRFPDTLIVWRPDGAPANADGPPLVRELVMFCPDPLDPSQLVEITAPGDNRPVSLNIVIDPVFWAALDSFKRLESNNRVVLTDLLRVGSVTGDSSTRRGAVRFARRLLPSQDQWQAFRAGAVEWDDINWVQDIHGSSAGLRQAWLRVELQLTQPIGEQTAPVVPVFGSAALYYELKK